MKSLKQEATEWNSSRWNSATHLEKWNSVNEIEQTTASPTIKGDTTPIEDLGFTARRK
jgi:hypothetical protein